MFAVLFRLSASPRRRSCLALVTVGQTAAQDVRHCVQRKISGRQSGGHVDGDTWPQFYSKCTAEAKESAAAAEAAAAPAACRCAPHLQRKIPGGQGRGTLERCKPGRNSIANARPKSKRTRPLPPRRPRQRLRPRPLPRRRRRPPWRPRTPVAAAPPPVEAPPPLPRRLRWKHRRPAVAAPAPPVAAPRPRQSPEEAPRPKLRHAGSRGGTGHSRFPSAIAPAYAKEKPAKARLKPAPNNTRPTKQPMPMAA